MIVKKLFHIIVIFCFVLGGLTSFAPASADEVDVGIMVTNLPTNEFKVYVEPAGTEVAVTVIDPLNSQNPIFSGQQVAVLGAECYFNPHICATFHLPDSNLEPGWKIIAAAGGITIEHTVVDVQVTSVDLNTDKITGTIQPALNYSNPLAVLFFFPDCEHPENMIFSFDSPGNWSADFAGVCDIVLGSWGALNYFSEYGAQIGSWHAPAYTLIGFYQPVDMDNVYNVVKNGSTVPLKFEVFFGSTELTDTAEVNSLTFTQITCEANALMDSVESIVTGDTSLRYDTVAGQFIYNWKTPKTAGTCYEVVLTTIEGSALAAYFKLK
jgi:hypothetical protein